VLNWHALHHRALALPRAGSVVPLTIIITETKTFFLVADENITAAERSVGSQTGDALPGDDDDEVELGAEDAGRGDDSSRRRDRDGAASAAAAAGGEPFRRRDHKSLPSDPRPSATDPTSGHLGTVLGVPGSDDLALTARQKRDATGCRQLVK